MAQAASVDTAGLAPGNYTVTATATDPKPRKEQGPLTCSSNFTVNRTAEASADSILLGEPDDRTCG